MNLTSLDQFHPAFQNLLDEKLPWADFSTRARAMVGALVANQGWLNNTLARLILDDSFLDQQYQSGDPNEIVLFRSPARSFSVRAFVWEPGVKYPVHDHGSWGIVGAYLNPVGEAKYRRLDDGQDEKRADLEMVQESILKPGETTWVMPLNDGIHQMSCAGGSLAITIHVYGSAVRKGYFQTYDMHYHTVHRVYPPHVQKRVLAIRSLGSMPETWSQEVLQESLKRSLPDYIENESKKALAIIKHSR